MNKYAELVAQINFELDTALASPGQGEFNDGCIFAYRSLLTKVDKLDHEEQTAVLDDMIKNGASGEDILIYLGIMKQPVDILFPKKIEIKKKDKEQPNTDIPEGYVNSMTIADLVGVSNATVCAWARIGMPFVTITGIPGRYFKPEDVIDWIQENKPNYEKDVAKGKKGNGARFQKKADKTKSSDEWSEEYLAWRHDIIDLIKSYKLNVNDILRWTYNELTIRYGIVWDQEKKDFKEKYGYPATSTMQLAYDIDHRENTTKLFESMVVTVCERNKED